MTGACQGRRAWLSWTWASATRARTWPRSPPRPSRPGCPNSTRAWPPTCSMRRAASGVRPARAACVQGDQGCCSVPMYEQACTGPGHLSRAAAAGARAGGAARLRWWLSRASGSGWSCLTQGARARTGSRPCRWGCRRSDRRWALALLILVFKNNVTRRAQQSEYLVN